MGVEIIRVAINLLLIYPRKIRHVTTHSSLLNSRICQSKISIKSSKVQARNLASKIQI